MSFGRGRFLAALGVALALLATAPVWGGAVAHAQQCVSDDPPCPPPPPLSVGVQSPSDTVRTNPVTVSFTATGLGSGSLSASATLDGVAVGAPTWQYESNGASVSGYVQVSPQTDGSHTVVITFCEVGRSPNCAWDAATVIYKSLPAPPAQAAPIVTQEPGAKYRRSFAGCAGCAYATLSYGTPGYRSLDQAHGLTLLYSSATSAPRGTVVLDVDANSTTAPDRISILLVQSNGSLVTLSNGQTEMFYAGGLGLNRITAQFDAIPYATNLHSMTAVVRNWWGATMMETLLPIGVPIVNDQASGFGSGWSVAGMQMLRLPQGGSGPAVISENGQILVFQNCGWVCWKSPPGEGSTLQWQNNHLQRRYLDGTIVDLDGGTGLHTFTRDRFGLQTTFAYDGYARLTQITDPAGIVTSIAWSGPPGVARTASITAPSSGGGTTQVNISASGELISIVDPDNVTALTVGYSGNRITSATNRIGGTTTYAYDSYGGLASVSGPAVQRDDGQVRSSTTTYVSRESALLPASGTGTASSPAARVLAASVWVRATSQRGDNVKVLTNGAGDVMKSVTTDAAGKVDSTVIGYNFNQQPASVWSTSGTRMEYRWDGPLLVQTVDNVAGVTTDYYYNAFGQDTATRVNQVFQQKNYYSADARSVLDSSKVGTSVSRFTYDALGRVLTATDPAQHQTSFSYESGAFQNIASVTKNGSTTQFGYDTFGRQSSVTNALGQVSSVAYDLLNRPSTASAPAQGSSSWSYNDASRSYSFTDGKQQTYSTTTNALGLPVAEVNPFNVSLSDTYAYDNDGNLAAMTTRAGRSRQIERDILGRPIRIKANGVVVTTTAYDSARKWTAYSTGESIDTVFVDGDGRVTKQVTVRAGMTFNVISTYGASGARQSLAASSSLWPSDQVYVASGVDELLRPDRIGDPGGNLTTVTYNQDQQPYTLTHPTGTASTKLRQTLTYNGSDQLATITSNYAGDALTWGYNYDALGRLSVLAQGEGVSAGVRTADYDAAGRLNHWVDYRTVELPGQWICPDPFDESSCYMYYGTESQAVRDVTYGYDAVGNRTDLSAAVQPGNRLTYFNGFTMQYDNDGNMISKTGPNLTQSFVWNDLGQLVQVTTNGVLTTFGYDGLGRRVRKTHNGVTTRYLHDGDDLIVQMSESGVRQLDFSYYPGIDHPHVVRKPSTGEKFWYGTSQPGNVVALVNASNQVVNRYEYTPFGDTISATGSVLQPFRFAGREFDSETGLYYNRARYYDPSMGRFISEDPIGLAGGVNQYAYVENDPMNYRDPSGLETTCSEWTLTWKQVDQDRWVGALECTGVTTLDRVTVTAQGGGRTPGARDGGSARPGVDPGGGVGPSGPSPAHPSVLACVGSGTVDNFMATKEGVHDLIGYGGQWAFGMVMGGGMARAIGVPRIGGVALRYGSAAVRGLATGVTPELTATIVAWDVELVGASAVGAGLIGTAITAPLVYGALNFGYAAGSLASAIHSCVGK